MLDAIMEFILETVLGGTMEAVGSKGVPPAMRVLLAGVVLLFLLSAFGWLLWAGIRAGNPVRVLIGAVFLAGAAALVFHMAKQFKQ